MKLPVLIASLLLLFLPPVAQAQTPVAIDGLQVIAERQYATDPGSPLDTSSKNVFLAGARVYLFNSPEAADSTWNTLVAAESVTSDLPADDDSVTYEKTEVENAGDRAMVLSLSADMSEGETGVFRTFIVQKDTTIITVTAIAGSMEAAEIADTIGKAMIEREAGDGESQYDGMGASTGGVWEIFLPAEADELGDLQAYADKETRPA